MAWMQNVRDRMRERRLKRLGVPALRGDSHESLRAINEGGSVFVMGNGPSAIPALKYVREHYPDALSFASNAGAKLLTPSFYVFVDAFGLLEYGQLIDIEKTTAIIQPSAIGKIRNSLEAEKPELVQHIRKVCENPKTLRLEREKRDRRLDLDPYLRIASGYTVGAVSLQLAMTTLLPKLDATRASDAKSVNQVVPGASERGPARWASEPKPGKIIVAGMDGYDISKPSYFDNTLIESAEDINRDELAERHRNTNIWQEAVMIQVIALAAVHGLEVLNLSQPGKLGVNELCRCEEFDREQET